MQVETAGWMKRDELPTVIDRPGAAGDEVCRTATFYTISIVPLYNLTTDPIPFASIP